MTTFTRYKRLSTCYRIAAVLDWIRAIRRESSLFFGRVDDQIRLAIAECESALADRPAVEDNALKKLAQLWQLTLPGNSESVTRLSKQMHRSVEQCLSVNGLNQSHELTAIDKVSGVEAARHISASVTKALGSSPVPDDVLSSTWHLALQLVGPKEAWIYRDWQQSIGESMLRAVEGPRRYDVISFGEFSLQHNQWTSSLWTLVTDIDVGQEGLDLRVYQLRKLARATASLVCSIETLDLERRVLDPQACELAGKFLAGLPAMDTAA